MFTVAGGSLVFCWNLARWRVLLHYRMFQRCTVKTIGGWSGPVGCFAQWPSTSHSYVISGWSCGYSNANSVQSGLPLAFSGFGSGKRAVFFDVEMLTVKTVAWRFYLATWPKRAVFVKTAGWIGIRFLKFSGFRHDLWIAGSCGDRHFELNRFRRVMSFWFAMKAERGSECREMLYPTSYLWNQRTGQTVCIVDRWPILGAYLRLFNRACFPEARRGQYWSGEEGRYEFISISPSQY